MAFWNRSKDKAKKNEMPPMPKGRVSIEEDTSYLSLVNSLMGSYQGMALQLPFELYDYVELLSLYNADFSQAVDNVKNLANPGFDIIINSKSERKAQKYRDNLNASSKILKPEFGGLHGIVNQLARQGAVYGAMCGEWILDANLTNVVDFSFISPKNIRFIFNKGTNKWIPFQKVTIDQAREAKKRGQNVIADILIELNPITFQYYVIFTYNNNPYGIPPFFAALEPLAIQRELINNFKSITKKMGLLGILEVVIERLPMEPEETTNQYLERCQSFLTNYQGLIQNMVNEGGVIHFDDTKVENLSIAERAEGAEKLFTLNEEQAFSGLHTLPSVQGRSYSTTETYASVSYEILLRSIGDFTKGAQYIVEHGLWLMDTLWGTGVDEIKLIFSENKALNLLQKAQAEAISITNDLTLWRNKVINQTIFAQQHGYPAPVEPLDEPIEQAINQRPNLQPQAIPEGDENVEKPKEEVSTEEKPKEEDNG